MIVNDGWLEFIGFWARSNNKPLKFVFPFALLKALGSISIPPVRRLATAHILGEVVKDGMMIYYLYYTTNALACM